jgi:lactoylglutathione lyase
VGTWCQVILVGPRDQVLASWSISGAGAPDLSLIEDLALLRLRANRIGGRLFVSDVCADLRELLELVGLAGELGGDSGRTLGTVADGDTTTFADPDSGRTPSDGGSRPPDGGLGTGWSPTTRRGLDEIGLHPSSYPAHGPTWRETMTSSPYGVAGVIGVLTVGIPVEDQEEALTFYTTVLGMRKHLDMPMPGGGRWLTVAPQGSAETTLALVAAHDRVPAGVETGVRLLVADAEVAHRHLHAHGVSTDEVLRWPGVPPMFAFRDPDGNGLELVEAPAVKD